MIGRRALITLLGGAAAWPLAARAQQPIMPVIGLLGGTSRIPSFDRTFLQGLREVGFIEGQNVRIEYRWAGGAYERLPDLAAGLVQLRVAVIVAIGAAAARVAKTASLRAAPAIPVVFTLGTDPVADGLVESLSRPGFNVTGATVLNVELAPKRLQVLKELLPEAKTLGVLLNPADPQFEVQSKLLLQAAQTLGVQIDTLLANTAPEIDAAFERVVQQQLRGLAIGASILFNVRSEQLGALSLRHAVPTIFQTSEFTSAGGLMSYGSSLAGLHSLAGVYAGRVLSGQKPADLPVQQATKIEMIINLKTAKALGLEVPPTLLARADEVIE